MKNIFKSSMKKKEKEKDIEKNEELTTEEAIREESKEGKTSEKEAQDTETNETNCSEEKENLHQKIQEMNEKYLRIFSEFDNYRKRTIKEKNELISYASSQLIIELLPVLDDFERAFKTIEKTEANAAFIEGIELIYNKFWKVMERQGLKPIEAIGSNFDTDFHEAITKIQVDDELKGKVYDEVQKGYMLSDKIIRFSKVVVGE
ncbi:MAG: nucleotide exchange factor GrpE [Bacteroidales bacterium]|nr:nucleotide exchange factor GrpE [Bacteroidales bacterium]